MIRAVAAMARQDTCVLGIGDDAAVLKHPSSRDYLLFTTDMLAEDVHFRRGDSPDAVGHKSLACNISDIAAMGGLPQAAVVSLALPGDVRRNYVRGVYRGMNRLARHFGVDVCGGDIIRNDKIVINVALIGRVRRERWITRGGACPGDFLFVSGPLGGSVKTGRHLRFLPRVHEARYLARYYRPSAMIDVSDGLSTDLHHILAASGCGAVVYETLIPRRGGAALRQALNEGEDYELLFALPRDKAERIMRRRRLPVTVYCIGQTIAPKGKCLLVTKDRRVRRLKPEGFTHL